MRRDTCTFFFFYIPQIQLLNLKIFNGIESCFPWREGTEPDGEKQEMKKAKNLKESKSRRTTLLMVLYMLFLTKEMDSNSTKLGGNTRQAFIFGGGSALLSDPTLLRMLPLICSKGSLFLTGDGRASSWVQDSRPAEIRDFSWPLQHHQPSEAAEPRQPRLEVLGLWL